MILLSILVHVAVGVLTATDGASVFIADRLIPTFPTLSSRQCLPADFDSSDGAAQASACSARVRAGGLPSECRGPPLLALFYICYAPSVGHLNADATAFNISSQLISTQRRSSQQEWKDAAAKIFDNCRAASSKWLTPRQQAVYYFMCLKWSLFSNCDQKQAEAGLLDEAGALRRAAFLSGQCPLSPCALRGLLERATGRTFAECSQPPPLGNDPQQLYAAEVARVVCLLQDFTNYAGSLNIPRLKAAIAREAPGGLQLLREIIRPCSENHQIYGPGYVTAEEFVRCWAGRGVFSCVFQEANQIAGQFPSDCAISADVQ